MMGVGKPDLETGGRVQGGVEHAFPFNAHRRRGQHEEIPMYSTRFHFVLVRRKYCFVLERRILYSWLYC